MVQPDQVSCEPSFPSPTRLSRPRPERAADRATPPSPVAPASHAPASRRAASPSAPAYSPACLFLLLSLVSSSPESPIRIRLRRSVLRRAAPSTILLTGAPKSCLPPGIRARSRSPVTLTWHQTASRRIFSGPGLGSELQVGARSSSI